MIGKRLLRNVIAAMIRALNHAHGFEVWRAQR